MLISFLSRTTKTVSSDLKMHSNLLRLAQLKASIMLSPLHRRASCSRAWIPCQRCSTSLVLTGITNEMVRNAPVFAEVAESLLGFMGDGIFVVHNVNFDYGFIAQEFARLGRRFPSSVPAPECGATSPGNGPTVLGALARSMRFHLNSIIAHCAMQKPQQVFSI